jgi:hypothetical protein
MHGDWAVCIVCSLVVQVAAHQLWKRWDVQPVPSAIGHGFEHPNLVWYIFGGYTFVAASRFIFSILSTSF